MGGVKVMRRFKKKVGINGIHQTKKELRARASIGCLKIW